jgi:hypothetical protein
MSVSDLAGLVRLSYGEMAEKWQWIVVWMSGLGM